MKRNLLLSALLSICLLIIKISGFSQGWVGNTTVNPNVLYALNGSNALTPLNVGIGTSSPTAQFHTTGSVRFAGLGNNNTLTRVLVQDANGNLSYRDVSTISSTNSWLLTGNTGNTTDFIGTTNAADFRIRTNNTQRMLINSSGNVSINSTVANTFTKLDINSTVEDQQILAAGPSPGLNLSLVDGPDNLTSTDPRAKLGLATRNGAFSFNSVAGDLVLNNLNNHAIIFVTNYRNNYAIKKNDEKMRIEGNGNVGIGTIAPTATLHTNGTVRFQNLPTDTGSVLVIDATGNVFRSPTASARPNAIQSEEVKNLKERLIELKNELDALKNQVSMLTSSGTVANLRNTDLPYLGSNIPNPFKSATVINYSIPNTFSNELSYINLFDVSGKLLKKYKIPNLVKGSLTINDLSGISSDILVCSLEINGKIYDYKKMLLTK